MLTQYVWYSRQFNADTICVVQLDSLMLTQYVWYSRQFNADTICVVQQTV